ncbi:MAG: sel1 repeat family protein [Betaproteobacteria bacterium]|nr:sel1 repeat family protein [Betaproteobacteria bacterium]
MSLIFDLKQYYRIAACLSLALGLAITPADRAEAATSTAKQKAKTAAAKSNAAKQKTRTAAPTVLDPVTELEIISDEAIALNNALGANPDDTQTKQQRAELALRAARAAERALSRGDENLFTAYRAQIQKHFAGTRATLEDMSKRGIGAAEFALGVFALHGILEERNIERACASFAAALDKGFSGAKFRHAQCIEQNDPARAFVPMLEAADAGHAGAIERVGRICLEAEPPDAPCAYARLERASREGRLSATTLLGWMHAQGIGGKVDLARAARYYREAAQQGEPSARNNLGELYETGRGVAKDPAKAFDYYLAAAVTGFPPAQFNVGRLYATGKGTTKDLVAARHWLGEAAKAGVPQARQILDFLDQETETGK